MITPVSGFHIPSQGPEGRCNFVSVPHVALVELDSVFGEEIEILGLVGFFGVVLHLIGDVAIDAVFLRSAYREGSVAVLPSEFAKRFVCRVDVFACARFEFSDEGGYRDLCRDAHEEVCVVEVAADSQGTAA